MKFPKFLVSYGFRRKFLHILLGTSMVIFINLDSFILQKNLHLFLVAGLTVSIIFSIIAKYMKPRWIIYWLERFDKGEDLKNFPGKGAIFYFIGTLISVTLFERSIASASILILAYGDPISFFVGRYYGKKRIIINPKKLIEGTLAGTTIGTLAASIFVPMPVAFFGAAMAMIAEAIELEFNLDDNFVIPIVAGLVMTTIINSL